MAIRTIRNAGDPKIALKRMQALMSAWPGTDDSDELDVLAALVGAHETGIFPWGHLIGSQPLDSGLTSLA